MWFLWMRTFCWVNLFFVLLFLTSRRGRSSWIAFPTTLMWISSCPRSTTTSELGRWSSKGAVLVSPVIEQAMCDTCASGSASITLPWDLRCLFHPMKDLNLICLLSSESNLRQSCKMQQQMGKLWHLVVFLFCVLSGLALTFFCVLHHSSTNVMF